MMPPRCLALLLLLLSPVLSAAEEVPHLPGTAPLEWQGNLADKMMDGLHVFIEGKIAQAIDKRPQHWKRDCSSPASYDKSVAPNRQRFGKVIGVVDPRLPVRLERFGDDKAPAVVAEKDRYRIYQVRWPVLDGVWGEGLLLEPKASRCQHGRNGLPKDLIEGNTSYHDVAARTAATKSTAAAPSTSCTGICTGPSRNAMVGETVGDGEDLERSVAEERSCNSSR